MTLSQLAVAASSAEHLLSEEDRHGIQISGLIDFPSNRWREAILFYLFGVWSDDNKVTCRPKINFGGVTLRLDRSRGQYYAYGIWPDDQIRVLLPSEKELVSGPSQTEVEQSLIRFVKNDSIKRLTIALTNQAVLWLWKVEGRRGVYGCCASGIPKSPF